jgi:ELWxxDGT repeat protein
VYFTCERDLWTSDGTAGGTTRVPGAPTGPAGHYGSLVAQNGRLAFFYRPRQSEAAQELWTGDGTAAGTTRLAGFPSVQGYPGSEALVVGDALYFEVLSQAAASIWRSDGTAASTRPVASLPVATAGRLTTLGTHVVFVSNGVEQATAWRLVDDALLPMPVGADVNTIEAIAAAPHLIFFAPGSGIEHPPALHAWCCAGD